MKNRVIKRKKLIVFAFSTISTGMLMHHTVLKCTLVPRGKSPPKGSMDEWKVKHRVDRPHAASRIASDATMENEGFGENNERLCEWFGMGGELLTSPATSPPFDLFVMRVEAK